MTLRIAMWSGPRNISTAMMRAFENRPDTEVWDEPFYGHYLDCTGISHPGAEEIIQSQGTDWRDIARRCLGSPSGGSPVFYQKHMTMHLLPAMEKSWIDGLLNCFLIRRPDQVVASYSRLRPDLTLMDIGFLQQTALFEYVHTATETLPLVIDSQDFLMKPEPMLHAICEHLGITYRNEMMSWPSGPRDSDGVWGKYWYRSVWDSTSFEPYREKTPDLDTKLRDIAEAADPYYQMLYRHRLIV